MGAAWGFVDSSIANFIMANQDTVCTSFSLVSAVLTRCFQERGPTSLTSTLANNAYTLGAIFMLGFNYGTPTVYSGCVPCGSGFLSSLMRYIAFSYDYSSYDQGAPQNSQGYTNAVTCNSNGWRCKIISLALLMSMTGCVGGFQASTAGLQSPI